MDSGLLTQLCRASVQKGHEPERDVPWGSAPAQDPQPILPDTVASLAGLPEFAGLSPAQRARVARHEASSMFSAFVRFEGFLNERLADWVTRFAASSEIGSYALHVIEEEARHSRMFLRLIDELGTGSYARRGLLGRLEACGMAAMRRSQPLFLFGMLAVEEISDAYFARILDAPGGHPVLRAVCRIHRIEESRHMAFARDWLRESYAAAGRFERLALRLLAPAILTLTFEVFVPPEVYQRAGVVSDRRSALRLWRRARSSAQRVALRRECSARLTRLFDEMGAIPSATRPLWQAARLLA